MPSVLLLLLMACKGCLMSCKSCWGIGLPPPPEPQPEDTEESDTDETAETGHTGTIDTGDPPCDVPEVESNNNPDQPQMVGLELWACGDFDAAVDPDSLGFAIEQDDWLKLSFRSASIGSYADLQVDLIDEEGDYNTRVTSYGESNDPGFTFPATGPRDFVMVLSEAHYGYGEDYFWEAMASVTKPPLEWTGEEIEPNDDVAEGTPLASGDQLFGVVVDGSDLDWYRISIPDDSRYVLQVRVYANRYGSPANLKALLYNPEGSFKEGAYTGENDYDRDPWMEYGTDLAGDWGLLIREEVGEGSLAYWYVVTLTVTATETDTGGGDTGPGDTKGPDSVPTGGDSAATGTDSGSSTGDNGTSGTARARPRVAPNGRAAAGR